MSSMTTLVPVISVNLGPNRLRRWSSSGWSRTWYLTEATPFVFSGIWTGGGATTGAAGARPPAGFAGAAGAAVGAPAVGADPAGAVVGTGPAGAAVGGAAAGFG